MGRKRARQVESFTSTADLARSPGHSTLTNTRKRLPPEIFPAVFKFVLKLAGGMRRSRLRGLVDVTKRYLIAAAAHNLGRILRKLFGIGNPRTLQEAARPHHRSTSSTPR